MALSALSEASASVVVSDTGRGGESELSCPVPRLRLAILTWRNAGKFFRRIASSETTRGKVHSEVLGCAG